MGPSWEAEQGWDKARHSLGTPLLPAQTARGVCTSGVGSSPLAVTPWWATTLSPTLLGHQEEPRGTTRGVEHRIQALGAGIGHHARTRGFGSEGSAAPTALPLVHDLPGSARRHKGHGDKHWGGHGEDRAWKAQGTHLWHGLAPASGQLLPEEPAWSRQL